MGVRGLTSWCHKEIRKNFTFEPNNGQTENQIFIVDGLATQNVFFESYAALDLSKAFEMVKTFVDMFLKCGFELIVVFDTSVSEDKLETWFKRRVREHGLLHE